MKFLHLLILFVGLLVAQPPAGFAEAESDKLTGTWLEIGGKDNLVTFNKEGTFKLYLKKGEIQDLHFLEGTWSLTPEARLSITVKLKEESKTFTSKLKFEGEEMILMEDDGSVTRHKRHVGAPPDRFNW